MSADDHVTETWTCAGRRGMAGSTKVFYAWRDADGKEREFDKLKGQAGRRYEVDVAYKPEDRCSVMLNVRYVDALPLDDPDRIAWEARERADLARIERDRLEAKDAEESALTDLVAPLREQYRRQFGPARKAAFLAVVIEMVTR